MSKEAIENALHVLDFASRIGSFGGLNGREIRASIEALKDALSENDPVEWQKGVVGLEGTWLNIAKAEYEEHAHLKKYEGSLVFRELFTHPQPQKGGTPQSVEDFIESRGFFLQMTPNPESSDAHLVEVKDFRDFMAGKALVPVETLQRWKSGLTSGDFVMCVVPLTEINAVLEAAKGE